MSEFIFEQVEAAVRKNTHIYVRRFFEYDARNRYVVVRLYRQDQVAQFAMSYNEIQFGPSIEWLVKHAIYQLGSFFGGGEMEGTWR